LGKEWLPISAWQLAFYPRVETCSLMMIVIQVQPAVIVLLLEDKSTMAMHVGRGRGRDETSQWELVLFIRAADGAWGLSHHTFSKKQDRFRYTSL